MTKLVLFSPSIRLAAQANIAPPPAPQKVLRRIASLLATTHTTAHGSVFLTQKPLTSTEDPAGSSGHLLVRATNGKSKPHRKLGRKEKMSTVVQATELAGFYTRYAEV